MNYSVKPEEHELKRARRMVEEAIESSKPVLRKKEDVEVYLAWDGRDYVRERMNGAQGRTFSSETITASFNSDTEEWENALKKTIAHEYAHAWFYEQKNQQSTFLWEWIVEEALAQKFAEKVFPDIGSPWNDKFSVEEIREHWNSIEESLDDEIGNYNHELFFGGENYPEWLGYSLAFHIGKKLLEDRELADFPEPNKTDVIEVGEELFER